MTSQSAVLNVATRIRPRYLLESRYGVGRLKPPLPSSAFSRPQPLQVQKRQIHFLPFLGIWGAKHLSAWTLYNACKNYGWPKVYRRLLEQNRQFNRADPVLQARIQSLIRMAIETPPKFASQVASQVQIIIPFLNQLVERAQPNLPPFLVAIAKFIVNSQKPVKIMQDLASTAAARVKK